MSNPASEADLQRTATLSDKFWMGLCAMSLVCYLLRSEAVPAFMREVSRLVVKL